MTTAPHQRRFRRSGAGFTLALLAAAFAVSSVAQAAPPRTLRGVQAQLDDGTASLRIVFDRPMRYRRHSPARGGKLVQVTFDEISRGSLATREAISGGWPEQVPVSEIRLAEAAGLASAGLGSLELEVLFTRRVEFRVKPSRDLRSITIEIETARSKRRSTPQHAAKAVDETASSPGARERSTPESDRRMLADARTALRDGDNDRAVALLTHLAMQPGSPEAQDAQELLGLARERQGKLAHAAAEYDAYLEKYPTGEGAERVAQRRAALETRTDAEREPLRTARAETRAPTQVRGSVAVTYRRSDRENDLFGEATTDDAVYSDLFLRSNGEVGKVAVRAELAGGYLVDLRDGRDDDVRANTAFVEAAAIGDGRLSMALGRQPGHERGLGSRFDGLRLTTGLGSRIDGTLLLGFPAEPTLRTGVETERRLVGLSFDVRDAGVEGLEVQLFGVHQTVGSRTDRSAVGTELRFASDRVFGFGLVDYDIYHGSLNAGVLSANIRLAQRTHLYLQGESRNLPYLTTSNALFGQFDDDLDDLRNRFTGSEIERLAEDRTIRS